MFVGKMVVLMCLRKALGSNVEYFVGVEHKQGPSRLKKRPDAWRARRARCTAPTKTGGHAAIRWCSKSKGRRHPAWETDSLPVPVPSIIAFKTDTTNADDQTDHLPSNLVHQHL